MKSSESIKLADRRSGQWKGASDPHSRESPTVTTFHFFLVLSWDWSTVTSGGSPNTAFCFAATRTLSLFCSYRSLGREEPVLLFPEVTSSQPLPVQKPLFATLWELKVLAVLFVGSFSSPLMMCHLFSSSYSFWHTGRLSCCWHTPPSSVSPSSVRGTGWSYPPPVMLCQWWLLQIYLFV